MAGIVLAGGRSQRMGRDKAWLDWKGEPLFRHVARTVAEATGPVILVFGADDRFNVEDLWPGVQVARDIFPDAGPIGGLITGLREAGPGHHVAVACDMPLIQPALLRLLLVRTCGFDAAIPEVDGLLEPLCAAYDARCVDRLIRELGAGRMGLQKAVSALDIARIPEDVLRHADPELLSFTNINTPEEYVRAQSSG